MKRPHRHLPLCTFRRVLEHVAERSGYSTAILVGPSLVRVHSRARQRVMRILWRMGYSAEQIGFALERHHTTVLHGVGRLS